MKPNYSGRLLDRLIVIAAKQTAAIRQNPDDSEYADARGKVLRALVKAFWKAREELQLMRRAPKK